jgi:hypothetical protein
MSVRRAAALLPVLLVGAGVSSAPASASTCSSLRTMSASSQPACWTPFATGTLFNTALPTAPQVAAGSAAIHQHMASYGWHFQSGPGAFTIADQGSRPVYFARPSDPVMNVDCVGEYGPTTCQGANGVDVNGAQIHVPAGAKPGSGWDAHMIVIETDTGQEYDFWHASVNGSTLRSGTGAMTNASTGNGTGGSGDAASLSMAAGLLRPSELLAGHINHPLVIDIPCTNAQGKDAGYVYPASGGWGENCGRYWNESPAGAPSIGQLFKLNMTDAQIAASGAPVWERTIMTALAHYGAYAEDTNGSYHDESIYIFQQAPSSWTSLRQRDQWATAISKLGGSGGALSSSVPIPTGRLQVVDPCVPLGTCLPASTPQPVAQAASLGTSNAKAVRAKATRAKAARTKAEHARRLRVAQRNRRRTVAKARAARRAHHSSSAVAFAAAGTSTSQL